MKNNTNNMSLEDALVAYAKACKPLTDEEIEAKTKEIFGDGSAFRAALNERIVEAVNRTLAIVGAAPTNPQ